MPDSIQTHPRFGFTEQRMINAVLTNAALVGASESRDAGTRFAVVLGIFTLLGGAGTVRFFLEGTLDGTNWFVLSSTTGTTDFTGTGTVVLNSASDGLVDLGRFDRIRIRAAILAGAPVFTLQGICTGIARDAEKFDIASGFVRSGAVPTVQNGTMFPRPSGTLFANAQITATGVVLGGVVSFDVSLQGTPDGGVNWVTLGTVSVTADGSQLLPVSGEFLFSLGAFANLRWRVVDVGGAGAATAFDIDVFLGLDSGDWTELEDSSGGSPFDPAEVFVIASFGAPTAEVANTRTIGLQLLDADGAPISEIRKVELLLYDTSSAGDVVLALNAIFSAVNTGVGIAGLATNRLVMFTDAAGVANVSVFDAVAETTFITAVDNRGPQAVPQLIVRADQVALVYA